MLLGLDSAAVLTRAGERSPLTHSYSLSKCSTFFRIPEGMLVLDRQARCGCQCGDPTLKLQLPEPMVCRFVHCGRRASNRVHCLGSFSFSREPALAAHVESFAFSTFRLYRYGAMHRHTGSSPTTSPWSFDCRPAGASPEFNEMRDTLVLNSMLPDSVGPTATSNSFHVGCSVSLC